MKFKKLLKKSAIIMSLITLASVIPPMNAIANPVGDATSSTVERKYPPLLSWGGMQFVLEFPFLENKAVDALEDYPLIRFYPLFTILRNKLEEAYPHGVPGEQEKHDKLMEMLSAVINMSLRKFPSPTITYANFDIYTQVSFGRLYDIVNGHYHTFYKAAQIIIIGGYRLIDSFLEDNKLKDDLHLYRSSVGNIYGSPDNLINGESLTPQNPFFKKAFEEVSHRLQSYFDAPLVDKSALAGVELCI